MKIAAHTLACPDLELLDAIALFAELGFDAVEILVDHDYPCAIPPGTPDSALAEWRQRFDALDLPCVHVTPYVRELDQPDEHRRRAAISAVEDAIRIAHGLGASGVRILAGRRTDDAPSEREGLFVHSMRELARTASAEGIHLNIETKGWSFAHDARSMLRLLETIGSPAVGILLDPANQVMDGEDPTQDLALQVPFVRHVHFKDAAEGPAGDSHAGAATLLRPAGEGSVPWRTILHALREGGYAGHVSIEYERRWHPSILPPARAGLAEELKRLRGMLSAAYDRTQSEVAEP